MIKRVVFCLLILMAMTVQAKNENIHSGSIIKATLTSLPKCLHYQFSGHHCVWMSGWGVMNTTPVVSHYLPDIVISVFNKPHDNPWFEVNKILDKLGQPIQQKMVKGIAGFDAGSGSHSFQSEIEQNVSFKEADVIGNPALAIIPEHGLLPSTATVLVPYFQSMTDSSQWRGLPPMALYEEGLALGLNVMHHVGTGFTVWGGIYPHEGKVVGDNDEKVSAVIAQRAGDLITSNNQFGHIYKNLSNSCGEHCSAAPIQENSKETYFQMIYPIVQDDCHILGDSDSYTPDMLNSEGSYVWVVWRHYEGCADGNGRYLGSM